jgi:hypothetical protein
LGKRCTHPTISGGQEVKEKVIAVFDAWFRIPEKSGLGPKVAESALVKIGRFDTIKRPGFLKNRYGVVTNLLGNPGNHYVP